MRVGLGGSSHSQGEGGLQRRTDEETINPTQSRLPRAAFIALLPLMCPRQKNGHTKQRLSCQRDVCGKAISLLVAQELDKGRHGRIIAQDLLLVIRLYSIAARKSPGGAAL